MQVRFDAGAAEAAGTTGHVLELPPGATVADLKRALADGNDWLGRVLPVSAVFADGVRLTETDLLDAVPAVDVLPPFAGG